MTQQQELTIIQDEGVKVGEFHLPGSECIQIREADGVWFPYSAPQLIRVYHSNGFGEDMLGTEVIDMGSGSGILSVWAAKKGASVLAVDFNPAAINNTRENALVNGVGTNIETILSDRFTNLGGRRVNRIIGNLPVQPWLTTGEDLTNRPNAAAWNEAGENGRLLLDSCIIDGADHLLPGGDIIINHSSRHGENRTNNLLSQHWGNNIEHIAMQIYKIDKNYHGPYIPIWNHLDKLDGEKRLLSKSDADLLMKRYDGIGEIMVPGGLQEFDEDGNEALYYSYFVTRMWVPDES